VTIPAVRGCRVRHGLFVGARFPGASLFMNVALFARPIRIGLSLKARRAPGRIALRRSTLGVLVTLAHQGSIE